MGIQKNKPNASWAGQEQETIFCKQNKLQKDQ